MQGRQVLITQRSTKQSLKNKPTYRKIVYRLLVYRSATDFVRKPKQPNPAINLCVCPGYWYSKIAWVRLLCIQGCFSVLVRYIMTKKSLHFQSLCDPSC